MPASHKDNPGNTRREATVPRMMVSSIPMLNSRNGSLCFAPEIYQVACGVGKQKHDQPYFSEDKKTLLLQIVSRSPGICEDD